MSTSESVGDALGWASGSVSSLGQATVAHPTGAPSSNPFPVVTYRHLLSAGSLTPSNPLRVVAHCDVDAAYAQFEAKRLGIDSFAVPVAVQQWQGLIAISYKAREFGINRHCDIAKALTLCPELQTVHVQTIGPGDEHPAYHKNPRPETHKVSLDPYRRESRKILASFKSTCPLGQVEKASIDESYFDLTLEVRKLILTRYPHLKTPPKTGRGMDEPLPAPPMIEWDGCGDLMPIKQLDADGKTRDDGDGFVPSQEHQLQDQTWTDVALAHGALLMTKVRRAVLEDVGYSTSAGIASNKTLAKLCSGYRKPNGQTTLLPRAVPAFLRELPVSKIRFLGGKLGREIGDLWDATTVGDLWNVSLDSMQLHFGPEAAWVHAVLRGVDHAPVSARIANKTMLASKNVRPSIRRRQDALKWLDMLSTELVVRLREIWEDERGAAEDGSSNGGGGELIPTLWPKFLVLRFIRTRGEGGPRSRQAPFPYVGKLTSADVYKVAERLWNDACDEMQLGVRRTDNAPPTEVVTIALGFSGLERAEAGQKTIERFFAAGGGAQGKRKREPSALVEDDEQLQWKCDECDEVLRVRVEAASVPASEEVFDEEDPFANALDDAPTSSTLSTLDAQSRLDRQVQDHQDWHFAVKLSAQDRQQQAQAQPTGPPPSAPAATASAAKKPKKGSLQSFFAKQAAK